MGAALSLVDPSIRSLIQFLPFSQLRFNHQKFPKYTEKQETIRLVSIEEINEEEFDRSIFIYISHPYFSHYLNWEELLNKYAFHRIDLEKEIFDLCIQGIDKILSSLTENIEECYLWMDYSCTNMSLFEGSFPLDKIIGCCDVIFTPIYDQKWTTRNWPNVYQNYFTDYKSHGWRGKAFSYINNGWCRLEMFLGGNLPIIRDRQERQQKFRKALLFHRQNGRRPHLLFGTKEKESVKGQHPIILFPLQNSLFSDYHPLKGSFVTSVEKTITSLLLEEQLLPRMTEVKVGYIGETNRMAEPHGRGKEYYPNGEIYTGDWVNGRKHGKGKYIYASGDIYEGDIVNDQIHGNGIMMFSDGRIYEGEFQNNLLHGRGIYRYPNGTIYDGNFILDKEEGYGILWMANGDVYEGEWKNGQKHGKGRVTYALRGEVYEGNYSEGKKHGHGIFYYQNGNRFEGEYQYGKKHGIGKLFLQNGNCFEGEFIDDHMNPSLMGNEKQKVLLANSSCIDYQSSLPNQSLP